MSTNVPLSDFVEQTILEVLRGVERAQAAIQTTPEGARISKYEGMVIAQENEPSTIRFDVSVGATTRDAVGADGGVRVAVLGMKARGEHDSHASSLHRIGFEIPVWLPLHRNPGQP